MDSFRFPQWRLLDLYRDAHPPHMCAVRQGSGRRCCIADPLTHIRTVPPLRYLRPWTPLHFHFSFLTSQQVFCSKSLSFLFLVRFRFLPLWLGAFPPVRATPSDVCDRYGHLLSLPPANERSVQPNKIRNSPTDGFGNSIEASHWPELGREFMNINDPYTCHRQMSPFWQ